jgi:hypothetical protein
MDTKERIELSKLIKQYDVEDTTQKIRELKHSKHIKHDVATLQELKKQYSRIRLSNHAQFRNIAERRCSFIYQHYTNIFNKLLKDELNLNILAKFLVVLERIENGFIDQHEASYEIGSLLKDLYIDSAIKNETNKNNTTKSSKKSDSQAKPVHNVSWSEFKTLASSSNTKPTNE